MINKLEKTVLKLPVFKDYYFRNAAKLKREYYLFLHRFGKLNPVAFVLWLATYKCNLKCIYCEASSGVENKNELSTDEVKILIRDLKRMGVKRFLISGGEPLTRPDLIEIIQFIQQNSIMPGLISNGYLVEEYYSVLRKYNYFFYQTSLDGIPRYHDKMRGGDGSFERAIRGLELFAELSVPVRIINTVIHSGNIDQLEEMFSIVIKSRANRWQLTPVAKVGRAVEGDFSLDQKDIRYIVDFVQKNRKEFQVDFSESHAYLNCLHGSLLGNPFFCGAGLTRCSIMPCGEVLGCNQVYDLLYSEGNIREKSFPIIWQEGFKTFRKNCFPEECSVCEHFSNCQGGCWVEWKTSKSCLKSVWEKNNY